MMRDFKRVLLGLAWIILGLGGTAGLVRDQTTSIGPSDYDMKVRTQHGMYLAFYESTGKAVWFLRRQPVFFPSSSSDFPRPGRESTTWISSLFLQVSFIVHYSPEIELTDQHSIDIPVEGLAAVHQLQVDERGIAENDADDLPGDGIAAVFLHQR